MPSLALPRDHWYRHYKRGRTKEEIIRAYDLQLGDAWNFYFQGCLLAEDGHFERAIEAFEEAMSNRPKDKRNMRTYGMHFLDYLPHREKGVCLYHLERLGEAEDELGKSYTAAPSARAKWYLRELLSRRVKEDLPAPSIAVLSPKPPYRVSSREILLRGEVRASEYIDYLTVGDGRQEWVGTAAKAYEFERRLELKDGDNTVTLYARDLAGGETAKDITIRLDTEPPTVAVRPDQWQIRDEGGIRMVEIDGVAQDVGNPGDGGWHVFLVDGAKPSMIRALDSAGNAVTHTCRAGNEATISLPLEDDIIVQNEAFAIGGRAYSREGVDCVLIEVRSQASGELVDDKAIDSPSSGTQEMYFSQLLRLQPRAKSVIRVSVARMGIPVVHEERQVTVASSDVLDPTERLRVLVIPPILRLAREPLGREFHMEIEPVLTKRFKIIRRDEVDVEQLRQILQDRRLDLIEQLYVRKNIAKGRAASEVAEALMFVEIVKYGGGEVDETLEVRAHLMETGSGIRLLDVEAYGTQQELGELIECLCAMICQDYPALKAQVSHVGPGRRVRFDAGRRHGLHPGMTCLLYKATEIDTGAEKLKTYRKIPARGRITRTGEAQSRAKYSSQDGDVSVGDVLATR